MNEQFDLSPKERKDIPFGEMPPEPTSNLSKGYSITSLCLAILAFLAVFYVCASLSYVVIVGFLLSSLSIVMAIMAKRTSPFGKMPPAARVGMILACIYLAILITVLVIALIILLSANLLEELLNDYCIENFNMTFEEFIRQVESGSFTLPD